MTDRAPIGSDDFAGTGALSASWTRHSGAAPDKLTRLSGNLSKTETGSGSVIQGPTTLPTGQKRYFGGVIASTATGGSLGGYTIRGTNNNQVRARRSGASLYLTERSSAVDNDVDGPYTVAVDDTVYIHVDDSDNTIYVEVNDVVRLSATITLQSASTTMGVFASGSGTADIFKDADWGTWVATDPTPVITDCDVEAAVQNTLDTVVSNIAITGTVDGYLMIDRAAGTGAPPAITGSEPEWVGSAPTSHTLVDDGLRSVYFAASNGSNYSAWFYCGDCDADIAHVVEIREWDSGPGNIIKTIDVLSEGGFDWTDQNTTLGGLEEALEYGLQWRATSTKGVVGEWSIIRRESTLDGTAPELEPPYFIQEANVGYFRISQPIDPSGISDLDWEYKINAGSYVEGGYAIPPDEVLDGEGAPLGYIQGTLASLSALGVVAGDTITVQARARDNATPTPNLSAYLEADAPTTIMGAPATVTVTYVLPDSFEVDPAVVSGADYYRIYVYDDNPTLIDTVDVAAGDLPYTYQVGADAVGTVIVAGTLAGSEGYPSSAEAYDTHDLTAPVTGGVPTFLQTGTDLRVVAPVATEEESPPIEFRFEYDVDELASWTLITDTLAPEGDDSALIAAFDASFLGAAETIRFRYLVRDSATTPNESAYETGAARLLLQPPPGLAVDESAPSSLDLTCDAVAGATGYRWRVYDDLAGEIIDHTTVAPAYQAAVGLEESGTVTVATVAGAEESAPAAAVAWTFDEPTPGEPIGTPVQPPLEGITDASLWAVPSVLTVEAEVVIPDTTADNQDVSLD